MYSLHRTFTPNPVIHISAVVCGERSMEAATMLKSTSLLTNRTVQFHIVAEDHLHGELKNIFSEWQTVKSVQVRFKLYSLLFPPGENAGEWKRLFKPCAAQRLFLLVSIQDLQMQYKLIMKILVQKVNVARHFTTFILKLK